MSSRYRTASVLSTLAATLLLAGCPDPGERLREFESRIPDAQLIPEGCPTPSGTPFTQLPDISGNGLFALRIAFVPRPIQLYVTNTLTRSGATGTLDLKLEFLRVSDRTIIGTPIMADDIFVADTGDFCIKFDSLDIPAAANPLNNDATAEDVIIAGKIRTADLKCGVVS